jgi:hypothetical protein
MRTIKDEARWDSRVFTPEQKFNRLCHVLTGAQQHHHQPEGEQHSHKNSNEIDAVDGYISTNHHSASSSSSSSSTSQEGVPPCVPLRCTEDVEVWQVVLAREVQVVLRLAADRKALVQIPTHQGYSVRVQGHHLLLPGDSLFVFPPSPTSPAFASDGYWLLTLEGQGAEYEKLEGDSTGGLDEFYSTEVVVLDVPATEPLPYGHRAAGGGGGAGKGGEGRGGEHLEYPNTFHHKSGYGHQYNHYHHAQNVRQQHLHPATGGDLSHQEEGLREDKKESPV